jgi:hypothetical protein
MPETISRWINSFLQGRITQLQFNGIRSESMAAPAGVPQGSPLSPLLYMFYNADLLEIAPQHQGTRLGFIDDIAYGIQGDSGGANMPKKENDERYRQREIKYREIIRSTTNDKA